MARDKWRRGRFAADARRDQPRDVHRERGLESDDAIRRFGELALLFVVVVRRVVGRDHIDAPIDHGLNQRGAIAAALDSRVAFDARAQLGRA